MLSSSFGRLLNPVAEFWPERLFKNIPDIPLVCFDDRSNLPPAVYVHLRLIFLLPADQLARKILAHHPGRIRHDVADFANDCCLAFQVCCLGECTTQSTTYPPPVSGIWNSGRIFRPQAMDEMGRVHHRWLTGIPRQ